MNALRRRFGLRWQGRMPSRHDVREAMITAAALIGILLAFGIVGTMDYADEQRQEAERHAAAAERATAWLAECLNGRARFITEDQRSATVCERAWEVRL